MRRKDVTRLSGLDPVSDPLMLELPAEEPEAGSVTRDFAVFSRGPLGELLVVPVSEVVH